MKIFLIFLTFLTISKNLFAFECKNGFSAILFDGKTGQILYEKNADKFSYPASLTKVMTLYLTFEKIKKGEIKLNQKVKVSKNVEDVAKINKVNSLFLKEGDEISVEELIRASAIKSFNEASVALAELIAGDEWVFAKMMNEKAQELKMYDTNFRNASGLHEDGQYSNAYDMARLLLATQKDFSEYKKYFAEKKFVFDGKKYDTHNHFLVEYKGATGFKTGFTSKAGFNLMASAKRKDREINGVVLGCENYTIRDKYMKKIFDKAFNFNDFDEYSIFLRN